MSKTTRWTETDLNNLKNKGYKVDDKQKQAKPKKIKKISVEKKTIDLVLSKLKEKGDIDDYVTEYRFDTVRRFRFDWAILSLKIAVEYEGIMSKKSRHTTITGYSKDIEKYNLAAKQGWVVLRYTALNYLDIENDLNHLITIIKNNTQDLP